MRLTMPKLSLLLVLLSLPFLAFGQGNSASPYSLSLKRELSYGGAAALTLGTGYLIESGIDDIKLSDLDLWKVPAIDRGAMRFASVGARDASDITAYASVALPGLLIFGGESRQDAGRLLLMLGETLALNYGVTSILKSSIQRPRPYLYRDSADGSQVVESFDRTSLPSAHTSNAAAGGFFFGTAFCHYYPDSKLKPVVWTVAAGVPALTGYLRVRGGQHFPTDVIAGYLIGAAIGYAVPTLHRKPLAGGKLTVLPSGAGLYLNYALN